MANESGQSESAQPSKPVPPPKPPHDPALDVNPDEPTPAAPQPSILDLLTAAVRDGILEAQRPALQQDAVVPPDAPPGTIVGEGRFANKKTWTVKDINERFKLATVFPMKTQDVVFQGIRLRVFGGKPAEVPEPFAQILKDSYDEYNYWENWKVKFFGDGNNPGTGGHVGFYKPAGGWAPDESGDIGSEPIPETAST